MQLTPPGKQCLGLGDTSPALLFINRALLQSGLVAALSPTIYTNSDNIRRPDASTRTQLTLEGLQTSVGLPMEFCRSNLSLSTPEKPNESDKCASIFMNRTRNPPDAYTEILGGWRYVIYHKPTSPKLMPDHVKA